MPGGCLSPRSEGTREGQPLGRDTLAAHGLTPVPGAAAGPSMVKPQVNQWREARRPRRVPAPHPAPGWDPGTPGTSAPPGPQRVKSGRAGPGADVFGLCSWERKRPSEASALLVLRGKQEKKENCSFPGEPDPARQRGHPLVQDQ